jgi:hypothetical protein
MIYTSVPLTKQQVTSSVFSDHGNGNEAPGAVSDSRISTITNFICFNMIINLQYLWAFTASFLLGKPVKVNSSVTAAQQKTDFTLFEDPPLIVTFRGKVTEDMVAQLSDIGFTRQTLNKYSFYKGPASDSAVHKLVSMGGQADAYSPYGTVNIEGYACLGVMNRVLHGALGFLASWTKTTGLLVQKSDAEVSKSSWKDYAITKSDGVSGKGHFFPYFDGLVTPDKAFPPRFFVDTFGKLLNSEGKGMLNATKIIQSGWVSLSTTPPGLQLSHLLFGVSLCISNPGITLKPVILFNDYTGFVLEGEGLVVFKGTEAHYPVAADVLTKEISGMNAHDNAIDKIAKLMSELPLEGSPDKTQEVLAEVLTSQRQIHIYLKNRNIPSTRLAELKSLIDATRFREKYWDTTDRVKIAAAIDAICDRRFLTADAPFCLKSAAMFTKDPTFSTLAAFGLTAISLKGTGNNASFPVTRGGRFYKDFKQASLQGIPIFTKPLQTAYEDMTDLLSSGIISFKHSGNDKHGIARVMAQTSMIPHDTTQAKRIIDALVGTCVKEKEKKRKTEDDGEIDNAEEKRKVKKTKTDLKASAGLSALLLGGGAPEASTSAGTDDMEMDF